MPWEICFGHATDGIRQERYISVNSKSVVSYGQYSQRCTAHIRWFTKRRTRIAFLVLPLKLTHLRTKQEDAFYKINHILLGRTVQHCISVCKFTQFVPCVIPAHEATSGNSN